MGTISLLTNNTTAYNNNGLIRSKEYSITDIHLHPDFRKLFFMDSDVLERITNSIKKNGFDSTQPLHLWEDEGTLYLIDGHTRYTAAKNANLESVPCHVHTELHTQEDAYQYVLRLQINRRNLSESELLKAIEFLTAEYKDAKITNQSDRGRIVDKIAEEIKVSPRTIQKYQTINKDASAEMKEEIQLGTISVNQAYNKIKKSKETPKKILTDSNQLLLDVITKETRILREVIEKINTADDIETIVDALSLLVTILSKEIREI